MTFSTQHAFVRRTMGVGETTNRHGRGCSTPQLSAALGLLALACCGAELPQTVATGATAAPVHSLERSVEASGFSLKLSLAPLPNLLFQLDCLSETTLCAPAGYRALWQELGLDADDRTALARWKALRTHHTGRMVAEPALADAALLVAGTHIDLAERQRIAQLRARSLDDFEASIALLTSDAAAHELRRIAERFEPRFAGFWQRSQASSSVYFDDMARLLGDRFLLQMLTRASHFYEHAADSGEIYQINLIVQPHTSNPGTTAYQLERDFLVEAPERGKASDVIDVLMHELCHALLFGMPSTSKLALLEAFSASEDPYAVVDYGVFDEALATSFGNGLVFRHYQPSQDFARHSARNFRSQYTSAGALAAAFFPSFEALLASDVTVTSPEVLRALGQAARASYREKGPRPVDYLHSHVLVASPPWGTASERVRDAAFAGFPYLREFPRLDGEAQRYLLDHPLLNAALYLPSDADLASALAPLGVGSARIAELHSAALRDRGLVYALARSPKSYLFVFLARDAASAGELAESFLALDAMREGPLVEQLH